MTSIETLAGHEYIAFPIHRSSSPRGHLRAPTIDRSDSTPPPSDHAAEDAPARCREVNLRASWATRVSSIDEASNPTHVPSFFFFCSICHAFFFCFCVTIMCDFLQQVALFGAQTVEQVNEIIACCFGCVLLSISICALSTLKNLRFDFPKSATQTTKRKQRVNATPFGL